MPDWRLEVRTRLAGARLAPAREAEIVEELAQHLGDRYGALRARGVSDEEATATVLAELADARRFSRALAVVAPRESTVPVAGAHGARSITGDLWRDLRYALRTLRRAPGFTVIAVLCLALGIGATSTVFGIVDALFFRPPPGVGDPSGVVRPYVTVKSATVYMEASGTVPYPVYTAIRDQSRSLSGLAGYKDVALSVGLGAEARHADGLLVSGNYFSVLRTRPALGRFFTPEEDMGAGSPPVAVISYEYWRGQLGGIPAAIGTRLMVDGYPYTIVGVAPQRFHGIDAGAPAIWIPVSQASRIGIASDTAQDRDALRSVWLTLVGRLTPGATRDEARAEFAPLLRRALRTTWGAGIEPRIELGPILAARGPSPSTQATIARWLALAAALVLAIACANTANLLLARAMARRKEIGIRLSLGASRVRLVRQLLTESAVLALCGTMLGLLLAFWGTGLIPAVGLPSLSFFAHGRVLAFAIVAAVACVLVFGLVPALAATRADLAATIKQGMREGVDRRSRLRGGLMIVQVALATVLLVGAGLFVHSLRNVQAIQPGLDVEHLLAGSIDLASVGYSDTATAAFYARALERLRHLPGVRAATLVASPPLAGNLSIVPYSVPGGASTDAAGSVDLQRAMQGTAAVEVGVGSQYLATAGTPLIAGRDFTGEDRAGSAPVVIVNQAFAEHEWPGASALGRCIDIGSKERVRCYRVVGVAANAKYVRLEEPQRSAFFVDIAQDPSARRSLLIRVDGSPASLVPAVRRALSALDPHLPYVELETLTDILRPELQPRRLGASMFGVFGLLALVLAAIGLYGVVSYGVEQRTREVGIRMALGAQPHHVLRLVVRQGMILMLAGLAIGIAGAAVAARVVAHLLFGVSAADPFTFLGVCVLLLAVATLASYRPARRATRVDPAITLRAE